MLIAIVNKVVGLLAEAGLSIGLSPAGALVDFLNGACKILHDSRCDDCPDGEGIPQGGISRPPKFGWRMFMTI